MRSAGGRGASVARYTFTVLDARGASEPALRIPPADFAVGHASLKGRLTGKATVGMPFAKYASELAVADFDFGFLHAGVIPARARAVAHAVHEGFLDLELAVLKPTEGPPVRPTVANGHFGATLARTPVGDEEAGERFRDAAATEHAVTQVEFGAQRSRGRRGELLANTPRHERNRNEGTDPK